MLNVAVYAGLTLLLYVLFLLLATIHEAGHLAAGLMCRFTLRKIRVGLIVLDRGSAQKWSWKWDWRWRAISSGETHMSPKVHDLSRILARYSFYILGGPLANLLAASIVLPLAFIRGALGGICGFFVVGSVGITLFNLVPRDIPVGRSDGGRLYDIIFRPRRREQLLFMFCIRAHLYEIRDLSFKHRHKEALSILDEQMKLGERFLHDDKTIALRNWMVESRSRLEKAILCCDQQPDSADKATPDVKIPADPESL